MRLVLFLLAALMFLCCGSDSRSDNPLLLPSNLPYQTIAFDKIKPAHFMPAFETGIKEQKEEIARIIRDTQKANFYNTIIALEQSGATLARTRRAFHALTSAKSDEALRQIEEKTAPLLAAHDNDIFLNKALFEKVAEVYQQRAALHLEAESLKLLAETYQNFIHSGALLSEDAKKELEHLNKEEATLRTGFSNRLLAANKAGACLVEEASLLEGLSEARIQALGEAAREAGKEGKYLIALQNTTGQPLLSALRHRAARKQLFENSWQRADKGDSNDTRVLTARIAIIRMKKAQLLGFKNYAEWKLQRQMAASPERVLHFMGGISGKALQKVQKEAAVLQELMQKETSNKTLQPYDWAYYAEQVRKTGYNLDEEQIKPYFELYQTLEKGVFYAANKLYGLSFKRRTDIPVYDPEMRVYEVFDEEGTPMALFYTDYFARSGKRGGAWMTHFVAQSKYNHTKPVVVNVCNFQKPAEGQPALLSLDDVKTLFHEFGHALHGILSDGQYMSLSGTAVARDFVEFPSQFNENWALYPEVLKNYACHYQNKGVISEDLMHSIQKAATFNQGYKLTEYLAAAYVDIQWFLITNERQLLPANAFEEKALKKVHLYLPFAAPRYHNSYFQHIWSGGYAAGYYAYLWSEMLAQDAYDWFEKNGGMTRANGERFKKMILSKGNTESLALLYRTFAGRDPQITPLLNKRGLE